MGHLGASGEAKVVRQSHRGVGQCGGARTVGHRRGHVEPFLCRGHHEGDDAAAPVAPMLVPRLSREDTSIDGYDIPSGTQVLVSVWSIGRDPELWEAPEEFTPERFLDSRLDVKGQDYELLPFGLGRRMCPGYNLGLKVIQLSLANLLHGFMWRLPDVMELSMEEIFGLSTPCKFPLEVVVEPKLQAHLYAEV